MLLDVEQEPPFMEPPQAEMRGCTGPRNEKTPQYEGTFFFFFFH